MHPTSVEVMMNRTSHAIAAALLCVLLAPSVFAVTLQQAYEAAGPRDGYDKYVELGTGEIYTGGLQVGPSLLPRANILTGPEGLDVCIVGNGAILDLQGEQLMISYCYNRMDVSDLIVINGNIRYRGIAFDGDKRPVGTVRNVTFYRAHDYGVRLQRAGPGTVVERNLVVDTIDTGPDFIYSFGDASIFLPTGTSFSFGWTGENPVVAENWTWYSAAPELNLQMMRHYSKLCDTG